MGYEIKSRFMPNVVLGIEGEGTAFNVTVFDRSRREKGVTTFLPALTGHRIEEHERDDLPGIIRIYVDGKVTYVTRTGVCMPAERFYELNNQKNKMPNYRYADDLIKNVFYNPDKIDESMGRFEIEDLAMNNRELYRLIKDVATSGIEYCQMGKGDVEFKGKSRGQIVSDACQKLPDTCRDVIEKIKEHEKKTSTLGEILEMQ